MSGDDLGGQQLICTVAGKTSQIGEGERADCIQAGGEVGVAKPGTGNCFIKNVLTRSLGEEILQLGGTYELACNFRDNILGKSPVGQQLLKHYYDGLPQTFAIVASDPEVLFHAIKTWRSIWLVAVAMVALNDGSAAGTNSHHIRYTKARHDMVREFFALMRSRTKDRQYLKALAEIEAVMRRYVGQDAKSILQGILQQGVQSPRGRSTKRPRA